MRFRALVTLGLTAAAVIAPPTAAGAAPGGGPFAFTGSGAATSSSRAVVTVVVDPRGTVADYDVQYGTDTAYGRATVAGGQSVAVLSRPSRAPRDPSPVEAGMSTASTTAKVSARCRTCALPRRTIDDNSRLTLTQRQGFTLCT
jgi:hypothetical protein